MAKTADPGIRSKRMRIFAGPNGSGKSTIFGGIQEQYFSGVYVNADEIERALSKSPRLQLADYRITLSRNEVAEQIEAMRALWTGPGREALEGIQVTAGPTLTIPARDTQYEAAVVADLLRHMLLRVEEYFTFETVMSHESKVAFMERATAKGYKCYLYYICTEDSRINEARVAARVREGGHAVPVKKIHERYKRSLALLRGAINAAYRAFLFDNSGPPGPREALAYVEYEKGMLKRAPSPGSSQAG